MTAAVSVDLSTTANPDGNTTVTIGPGGSCAGDAFLVITFRQPMITVDQNGGMNNAEVAGNAIESNSVGFTIVIP